MGLWTDVVGTVRGYIRLGLTGVRLKNSSGTLAVRNAGDSAYAKVECDSIELGHASDTTLTRVSAGVVAVEGANVVLAGAVTTDGITMSTARLLGRTTAATGAIEEITVGSGLSLSAGSLTATGGGWTVGTPVTMATGSPTYIDYTNIPAGVTMIVISFAGASTNGTSIQIIQLGDAGGVEPSGYTGTTQISTSRIAHSSGFLMSYSAVATFAMHGSLLLTRMDSGGTQWSIHGLLTLDAGANGVYEIAGTKILSAELDRIRWTTVGGTDVADGGTMNIAYI